MKKGIVLNSENIGLIKDRLAKFFLRTMNPIEEKIYFDCSLQKAKKFSPKEAILHRTTLIYIDKVCLDSKILRKGGPPITIHGDYASPTLKLLPLMLWFSCGATFLFYPKKIIAKVSHSDYKNGQAVIVYNSM